MAIRDRNTLKGYFPTGGQPTQQQFGDVLDSTFLKNETVPIGNVTFGVQTLTYNAVTTNWDVSAGQQASLVLTGNTTLNFLNMQAGQFYLLVVKQDATGGHTITLPAGSKVVNAGGGIVSLSATPNAIDLLSIFYDGTNYFWLCNTSFT